MAIEEAKLLIVQQPLDSTIYITLTQVVIVKIPILTTTKKTAGVISAVILHQKNSCHWQYFLASD